MQHIWKSGYDTHTDYNSDEAYLQTPNDFKHELHFSNKIVPTEASETSLKMSIMCIQLKNKVSSYR